MIYRRDGRTGTRLDEPGVPHTVTQQSEQEKLFPFEASVDVLLCVDCTWISEQGEKYIMKQTSR